MTIFRNLSYLEKHRYGEGFDLPSPEEGLEFIFVIPYVTFSLVLQSLASFKEAAPGIKAEFLLSFISKKEKNEARIKRSRGIIEDSAAHGNFPYPIHFCETYEIPEKRSLLNMAYKTGMDEALHRFQQVGTKNGWIIAMDSGLEFPEDFFTRFKKAVQEKPKKDAIGFGFQLTPYYNRHEIRQRYIIEGLRYAGHPHAYYTLGNTFAYRQSTYEKHGGIPLKPKGFSFSFNQKFISQGKFKEMADMEIPREHYYPSKFLDRKDVPAFQLIREIKEFLDQLPRLFQKEDVSFPPGIKAFLEEENFNERLNEMLRHSASFPSFQKRFFAWFNLVRVSKFLEKGRESHPPLDAVEGSMEFFKHFSIDVGDLNEEKCLEYFRNFSKTYKPPA